jgi:Sap, sulfolipid-1-addressing protein
MPSEAVSLALAASVYPPALAAVIAIGRGKQVRLRVVLFVLAAYLTAFAIGVLLLVVFVDAGATGGLVSTPSAGVYLLAGAALLGLGGWLARGRARLDRRHAGRGPSRVERYLQSWRGVLALGVTLYVVPSPIFVGATKSIADTNASTPRELAYLAATIVIMLWLIELPMVLLLAFPAPGVSLLEAVNGWFARHGRLVAALAAATLGAYLIVVGLVELL